MGQQKYVHLKNGSITRHMGQRLTESIGVAEASKASAGNTGQTVGEQNARVSPASSRSAQRTGARPGRCPHTHAATPRT